MEENQLSQDITQNFSEQIGESDFAKLQREVNTINRRLSQFASSVHTHNGNDSRKIRVSDVVSHLTMTSTQLTSYLSQNKNEGDIFTVYLTDTSAYYIYARINKSWKKTTLS